MQRIVGALIILLAALPIWLWLDVDETIIFMLIIGILGIYYAYNEYM